MVIGTWFAEELLQPGKMVWLEMRGIEMPADKVMTTQKLRPRYMGPVKIKRRRRHWTFEVDIGNTKHHNVYLSVALRTCTPYQVHCA